MARIRSIKPSFWSDEAIITLSHAARLLAIGLISFADDDGRFVGAIGPISGYVFPFDEIPPAKIKTWLKECTESGFVHIYAVNGKTYGVIPNWHKHQAINKYAPSTLPEPDIPTFPRGGRNDLNHAYRTDHLREPLP